MGTNVHLIVLGLEETAVDHARTSARELIESTEGRLSRFRPDSEVAQLNRAGGRPVVVSRPTLDLIALARQAWVDTHGAFDPMLGRELAEAGYDQPFDLISAPACTPNPGSSSRRDRSGDTSPTAAIETDAESGLVVLPAGAQLDLGGIAKGATADLVAAHLMDLGASGCCVNIGGDLRVRGDGPDNGTWTVTLDCPGSAETRIVALVEGAVCTSSTTRRTWPTASGSAHHLIDPATGQSRVDGPQTVSAIAKTAVGAEVVTKWMLAGGQPEHFMASGLTVDRSGHVAHSVSFDVFVLQAATR